MSNPTANRSYAMPASTDTVTGLPTQFATFGDAVDLDVATKGGYTTIATAAGTTILTKTSARNQRFTGTTTQDVDMPDVTTLALGNKWKIQNKSTGIVTVKTVGGAATIIAIPAGLTCEFTCVLITGTTAASWDYDFNGASTPPASGVTFVGCQLYKSANQTLSNATWTAITFDSEQQDSDAFHSTSSNTSRITIPAGKAGRYRIDGLGKYNGTPNNGDRSVGIYVNGSSYASRYAMQGGVGNIMDSALDRVILTLAVGDYVELYLYQSTGGNCDIQGGSIALTSLTVTYLGA